VAGFIAAQRDEHQIPCATACRALAVSPAWFYKWRHGDPSPRHARREQLKVAIRRLFAKHRGTYGSPPITADLRDEGWAVSENTVAKVMAELGLQARRKRRRKQTTRQGRGRWRAPDLIGRDFPASTVNRKWYGDGTEIPTDDGKLYLDSVLDMGSRRIVGFALGEHHDADLAQAALVMAVAVRGGKAALGGVIMHTDQGSEYTAGTFQSACGRLGITQSMGRVGSALDKELVSYCTSWRWLGVNAFLDRASLPGAESWVAGGGWFEESLVLVVGLVGGQQAGAVPGLDGGEVHAEPFGDLGDAEQSSGMQPVGVAGQVVAAA
jgi:putative transposase